MPFVFPWQQQTSPATRELVEQQTNALIAQARAAQDRIFAYVLEHPALPLLAEKAVLERLITAVQTAKRHFSSNSDAEEAYIRATGDLKDKLQLLDVMMGVHRLVITDETMIENISK
jgi:hypothetical protein